MNLYEVSTVFHNNAVNIAILQLPLPNTRREKDFTQGPCQFFEAEISGRHPRLTPLVVANFLVTNFFGDHSEWHTCSHCFWLLLHGWQCRRYLTSEVIFYHGFSRHLFLLYDYSSISKVWRVIWLASGSLGNASRKSSGFFGFLWVPSGFFGFLRVSSGFFGFLWVSSGILGESSRSHPEVIPHPWNGLGF
jgi:hypothetical protein